MRVELERVSAQGAEAEGGESYRVLAVEDGAAKTMDIGRVSRVRGPTWSLMLKPESSDGPPLEILLNAETVDELKAVIRDRFGLLDMSADRLSDETMSDYAREVLRALSSLATKTNTIAGFTGALCHHLALVGAVDVKAEGREAFLETTAAQVRKEMADIIVIQDSRGALKGALRDLLDKVMKPTKGGDDGPVTH